MKFLMAIFKQYLKKYNPVATINLTEPTIIGVKMFSYEKKPNPDFLYVGHNNDFFHGSQSREVLLVHRKDVMSLSTSEIEDVVNELMECISYYTEWEQKLLSAYNKPNPEQAIIDSCADLFGPMFFTTMSLQITALSGQYPKGSVNRNWDDFLENGTLSLERFTDMKSGSYMDSHNSIWDCRVFYEGRVEKYQHSIMVSQVSLNGKLTGQLTIISDEPFEDYQIHLIPPIKNVLCLVSNTLLDGDRGSVVQSVFLDLIGGNKKEITVNKFYDLMGWTREQRCIVAVLKNKQSTRVTFGYDVDILRKEYTKALFCVNDGKNMDNEIICCMPVKADTEEENSLRFCQTAGQMGFTCGISYSYEGAENLDIQYRQAEVAKERGVTFFYDCAMYELAGLEGTSAYRKAALHPALGKIIEYDEKKHTDFYLLLETFLHNERNRVQTAAELYIHKNTLVYRLKKIEQLFHVNFDDIYDREYLLLSIICINSLR